MSSLLLLWIGVLIRLFRSRGNLVLENLVLRQQLAVLKRRRPRPRLALVDKLFWVTVSRFWSGWKEALIVVTPETVVRWHRAGFRMYWRLISRVRIQVGRRQTSKEVRELIFRMVVENPTWGAPRIHGELLMLGFGARPFLSLIGAFTRTAGSYRVEPHFRSFFVSPESVTILPRLQQ